MGFMVPFFTLISQLSFLVEANKKLINKSFLQVAIVKHMALLKFNQSLNNR